MSKKRRQHSPDLKARVGLEALKGIEPIHAIAAKFEVHPVQVSQWKKEAAERLPEVFARKADHDAEAAKDREKILFEEVGPGQLVTVDVENWDGEGAGEDAKFTFVGGPKRTEAEPDLASAGSPTE